MFQMPRPLFPALSTTPSYRLSGRESLEIVSRVFEDLYSRVTLTLRLCGGKLRVWKAGRGTRQDDSTGGDIFCAAYNDAVIADERKETAQTTSNNTNTTADRSTRLSSPSWTTLQSSGSTRKLQQEEKRHCSALRKNKSEKTPIHWLQRWVRSGVSWSFPRR